MVNPISLEEHFTSQSTHFIGEAILENYDSVAYCEDLEDAIFWGKLFDNFNPNYKFLFKYVSLSKNNARTTGKHQALQFKHCTSKKFVICIDTDYDIVLEENDFNIRQFIFQTYTYSLENHLCHTEHLNIILSQNTQENNVVIQFDAFFNSISPPLFEALILSVLSEKSTNENPKYFIRSDFNSFFNINSNDFNLSLVEIATQINTNIQNKIDLLSNIYSDEEIAKTRDILNRKSINSTNAFRFVRGHSIFDYCVFKIIRTTAFNISSQKFQQLGNMEKQGYNLHLKNNSIEKIVYSISHSTGLNNSHSYFFKFIPIY